MDNVEFIKYEPTPNDLYMLGIATVRVYGKVVLRYKMVRTKDGRGLFIAPPSYSVFNGDEKKYLTAFMLDSVTENEEILDFIRLKIKETMPISSEA